MSFDEKIGHYAEMMNKCAINNYNSICNRLKNKNLTPYEKAVLREKRKKAKQELIERGLL